MKRITFKVAIVFAVLLLLSGCRKSNDGYSAEVTVEFIFDLASGMPELDQSDAGTKTLPEDDEHDIRYQIRAYRQLPTGGYAKEPLYRATYRKDEVSDIRHSGTISISEGTYRILAWVDYVMDGSDEDLYYDTEDFSRIGYTGDEHVANTGLLDVFIGETVVDAHKYGSSSTSKRADIQLYRPVGKYEIITTDLAQFIRDEQAMAGKGASMSLDDFYSVITYRSYLPNTFNLTTGRPDDSSSGISYRAPLTRINDEEAIMGYDYILIPEETVISLSVAFYSKEGVLMAETGSFDVPLKRGHVTRIEKKFLTGSVGGGVDIDSDFAGDNNIPLN